MSEPQFHRINPRTIAVDFVKTIGRLIIPLIYFIYSWFTVQGGDTTELLMQGIGAFAVFASVARYLTFSYAVHEEHLYIRSGWITRQKRTIPLSKIQNINITKTLVHRLLGLVDLKIETAAGAGSEASLSALAVEDAERLKVELMRHVSSDTVQEDDYEAAPAVTVYKITRKELFLAGATENRGMAIIASIMGFAFLFEDTIEELGRGVFDRIDTPVLYGFSSQMTKVIIIGTAFFILGWLFSIVATAVQYAHFELTQEDGKLRRHYGLINQIESVVPLKRVQVMRTTETVFQRILGLCKLFVETAGSFGEKDMGGSALVSPLLESDRIKPMSNVILPGRGVDEVEWHKVSDRTIRHQFQKSMILFAVLVSVASLYFGPVAFWTLVPLGGWAYLMSWASYRTMGYDDRPDLLATRYGVFSRRTLFVPTEKIQSVAVRQSPLQRRLGIASLTVNTAATGQGSFGTVVDLPLETAMELAGTLEQRSVRAVKETGEVF